MTGSDEGTNNWQMLVGEPFDDLAGPFLYRRGADGTVDCKFQTTDKHTNALGIIHGGSLLTFADYCLFISGRTASGKEVVTVSVAADFVGSVYAGDCVEGRCEVVKEGRSLMFMRGVLSSPKGTILSFSSVLKKLKDEAQLVPKE